jgi:hypothetical protein
MLDTMLDTVVSIAPRLAGSHVGPLVGPSVYVETRESLGEVLDLGIVPVSQSGARAVNLLPDPSLRLAHPEHRRDQVLEWIRWLLFDTGYPAPDGLIGTLVSAAELEAG